VDAARRNLAHAALALTSACSPFGATGTESNDGGAPDSGAPTLDAAPVTGGIPATPILDMFERADSADGDLGADWLVFGQDGTFKISGKALRYKEGTDGTCHPAWAMWAAPFGPSQEVYVTLASVPQGGNFVLFAKAESGVRSAGARVELGTTPPPTLHFIMANESGAETEIGSPEPIAVKVGDQIGFRCEASGRFSVFKNGAFVAERTVSNWSGNAEGGRIAVNAACADNGPGLVFDDFGGGTLPSP
jgi:hypothetical protein